MITERIGLPALLEQLAEECAELAQAALKYSRALRKENPTPKTEMECVKDLMEEAADVKLMVNLLDDAGVYDYKKVLDIMGDKLIRWNERLGEVK